MNNLDRTQARAFVRKITAVGHSIGRAKRLAADMPQDLVDQFLSTNSGFRRRRIISDYLASQKATDAADDPVLPPPPSDDPLPDSSHTPEPVPTKTTPTPPQRKRKASEAKKQK